MAEASKLLVAGGGAGCASVCGHAGAGASARLPARIIRNAKWRRFIGWKTLVCLGGPAVHGPCRCAWRGEGSECCSISYTALLSRLSSGTDVAELHAPRANRVTRGRL